jgi:hypothetical protein
MFCLYCHKPGHDRENCLKLKRKASRPNHGSANNRNTYRPNFDSQDVLLLPLQVMKALVKTIGFVIVELADTKVFQ